MHDDLPLWLRSTLAGKEHRAARPQKANGLGDIARSNRRTILREICGLEQIPVDFTHSLHA
jgi:hypothetical protein